MFVIKSVFRFLVFLVAISAIVVILGTGYFLFANQSNEAIAAISIEGDPTLAKAPSDPEEFFLGIYLQTQSEIINGRTSDDPSSLPFTVEIGENARTVGQKLLEQNLITDPTIFRLFLQYNGLDASLEAGDYELRRNMTMREIAQTLQKANFDEVTVSIVEGWRAEQIAEHLTREGIMDGNAFLGVVKQGFGVEHPMLSELPPGTSYEGYLFPDTYRLPVNARPDELISRMLDNMENKISPTARQLAAAQGISFHEALIVASVVEREAVVAEERARIASVYLNRIAQGMYLQADPTVQYAMGYQPEADQWWKTPVTLEEYSGVDSPYNTYLNPGLPPGPIANAGAASILATLQPEETDYLFFMGCGGEGAHIFSTDFETHEQIVAQCTGG